MKINREFVALTAVLGVFAVLVLIVVFMGLGKGISKDFVSVSEIVTGVALTIFNVSGVKLKPEPTEEDGDGQLPTQ